MALDSWILFWLETMTFGRVARLDTEARKVFAVRLARDSVRNRMEGQCSGVEGCLNASLIESKVVLDGSKVKLRDPESILCDLKISWMFVESQQQAFTSLERHTML